MRALQADTLIDDRYRVISRIGSGGMADVYCAEDLQLGREVAVKLLHQRFAEDQEFVERFRREASSAASLSHPNVVSVFDRGEWDGTYYIAMEYLPGLSLKEIIRERGPLEPLEAIDLAEQVLRAARFAHRRGVVHRDLKPLNVIVDEEGRVKVTDFGIARAGASEITQTGSIMGTAQYLSPEQAQGRAVSPRSDLYAIGILLYELLTARVPFVGDSAVAIALKQISEAPVPPSALNPAVPPELDAIVLRALAKDPEQRFADADEFIAALTAARELIRSQAPGQTAEFAPADGGVAYEAPAYQGYEEPAYAQEVYETYEPPPRERRVWPWVLAALLVAAAIAAGVYLALGASKARVPNVVGEQQAPATTLLEKAGFTPVPLQATSTAPQGMVLAQSPAAGAKASKNSIVQITVSSGPGTTTVPDLGNRTEAAARSILIRRGFQVHVTRTPSADVAAGHVITTSPPAFSQAQKGSAITLQVSSGPQQVSVPDVVGQTQDNAAAILEAQGFKVVRTAQPSNQTAGTVISQTPAGNANAPMGSVVTLTVAKPAVQATVPSLVGQSGFAAAGALAAAGLRAATSYRAVTNPAQDGIVLRQSPRAGTKVRKGATVHLVLGRLTVPSGPTGTTSPVGATGAT